MRTSNGPCSGLGSPSLSATASSVSFSRTPSKPNMRNAPKRLGKSASAILFSLKLRQTMLPTIIEAVHAQRKTVSRAADQSGGFGFDREHPDALSTHSKDPAARRAFGRRSCPACLYLLSIVWRQRRGPYPEPSHLSSRRSGARRRAHSRNAGRLCQRAHHRYLRVAAGHVRRQADVYAAFLSGWFDRRADARFSAAEGRHLVLLALRRS